MIVVADASPLNYLVLVGHVEVLHELYAHVIVPAGVLRELSAPASPPEVRAWVSAHPGWIELRQVQVPADAGLAALDQGEAEAIVLAEGLRPQVLLLIDDRDGRREAARRGIAMTGTLGVLSAAAERGLVDLAGVLDSLSRTTFRASPALIREILARERRRRDEP